MQLSSSWAQDCSWFEREAEWARAHRNNKQSARASTAGFPVPIKFNARVSVDRENIRFRISDLARALFSFTNSISDLVVRKGQHQHNEPMCPS